MKARCGFPCALIASLLLAGAAHCQLSSSTNDHLPLPPSKTVTAKGDPVVKETSTTPGSASSWITYAQPDCCGLWGGNGPIMTELYTQAGISRAVGGSTLAHTINTGWEVQAGGRSLFFDTTLDRAWTIDLSAANINNYGSHQNLAFPVSGIRPIVADLVSVRALNRTFVTISPGREWYLLAPTNEGCSWRIGVDGGGRLGTVRIDLNDPSLGGHFKRRNDIMTGVSLAVHSDWEVPCGAFTFISGLRAEMDRSWLDIVGAGKGDLYDVSFLATLGIRF